MNKPLLDVYHALPGPLRSLAASLYGLHLRRWRYGPETEALVREALERERWSPERWEQWRLGRLASMLQHAARKVPFYRRQWEERRKRGEPGNPARLEDWPILEKASLRSSPKDFLADGADTRLMQLQRTSGTTGTPLELWQSRQTSRAWYALFEARWRRWHGVTLRDRWAILGGQLVVAPASKRPPYWVFNAPMNQLYLSSFHIGMDSIEAYLSALARYQVRYLYGYSSSLHLLARTAMKAGLRPAPLEVALTNAEPLTVSQREDIEAAFRCPVRETYGMAEAVAAAGECAQGRLHLWPEVGIVEVADDQGRLSPWGRGELVCTGLLNEDMPLVRYRTGDRASVPQADACACGRTLPVMSQTEGRANDMLLAKDGRKVFWINPVFYGLPIQEAQIIQTSPGSLRVLVVPDDGFDDSSIRRLTEALRARLGEDAEIRIERVASIPRSANGKFRAVVSRLARP